MQLLLTLKCEAVSSQDTEFSHWFEESGEGGGFECFSQWREVDKAHIRVFCQQYTSHSITRVKQTVEQLEEEIRHLEDILCTHNSTEGHTLK